MTDTDKPIGQSNIGSFFDSESVRRALAKTPAMVEPRHPKGEAGQLLTDVCQWCFNAFDYTVSRSGWQRTSVEYEQLCKFLHIEQNFHPVICQPCYEMVIGTAGNAMMGFETPGWSSNSTPNVVLARQS